MKEEELISKDQERIQKLVINGLILLVVGLIVLIFVVNSKETAKKERIAQAEYAASPIGEKEQLEKDSARQCRDLIRKRTNYHAKFKFGGSEIKTWGLMSSRVYIDTKILNAFGGITHKKYECSFKRNSDGSLETLYFK